jgi:N-succinyl-L-ornithine transcarbamylase
MKSFTSVHDAGDVDALLQEALYLKANPNAHPDLGKNKTLGLIFLNPSLRTRLSTQKAGLNLGMRVIVLNGTTESWTWELEDNAIMNGASVEHIKDAANVISQYCDLVGIRCFPGLKNRDEDYAEALLNKFISHCRVPVISLESATRHPLQSLADLITIREHWKKETPPKVVLTWAPHIKPLPQAVPNSFAEWMVKANVDLTIAHPEGYELDENFTRGAKITHNQKEALEDADFVYVKNWSSYKDYGQTPAVKDNWKLDGDYLEQNQKVKIMHCLPVRRNVELSDALLDSDRSLVYEQANNRTVAAQTILKRMLEYA